MQKFSCAVRRFLTRWFWGLVFLPGIALYPIQQYTLLDYIEWHAKGGDAEKSRAVADAAAKMVDWVQVYCKFSVAIGVFCLINLLAWVTLNAVMRVLPDWAKGDYGTQEAADRLGLDAPVVGFKRTFLGLSPVWRMGFYFIGFGLELAIAWGSVYAAFRIQ